MNLVLLSFAISSVMVANMIPRILVLSLRKRLFDPIDPRKIHSVPASRLGGVSFFPAVLLSTWISVIVGCELYPNDKSELFCIDLVLESSALLILFLIGVYDDIIGVKYSRKFAIQVIAAIFITYSGTYFTTLNGIFGVYDIPLFIGLPLTIFFLVFVTNAINLIDGLDGLSSSLSIMALVTYGVIFYINGELTDAIVVCAMLGALMPFCYNNIYGVRRRGRCKIFMGDTGALVVGAVLGFLAIKLWEMGARGGFDERHHITAVLAYSVLIIPCFDVVRIVIHRFRDHKPLFLPDKNHIHHKFLALGFTPRQSLKNILAMNTLFIIGNLSLVSYLNFSTIIVIDIVVWSTIHIVITKKIALRHKQIDNIM